MAERNNKRSKIESKQKQLSLCNLPDDVARLIFARLNWVDRVRLCATSKNFPSLLRDIPIRPTGDELPWLLFFSCRDDGGSLGKFELSDPVSKRNYSFKIMEQEAREHLLGAKVCSSNHGWVLLSREARGSMVSCRSFSLYTPFGKKFIRLPDLGRHNYDYRGDKVTFSMDPNSLQCVFNIWYDKPLHSVNISTCHIGGNSNWKNLNFDLPANVANVKVIEHVMYADGFVNCVFDAGRELGIFDVLLQEWRFFWDCMPPFEDLGLLPCELHYYCLVAFNGDLFLYGDWFNSTLSFLWRFDKSLKQWLRQKSLGDLTLFVLYPTILLAEAAGELSSYANTIHLLSFSEIKYMLFFGGRLAEHLSFRNGIGKCRTSILYNYHGPSQYDDSLEFCWI